MPRLSSETRYRLVRWLADTHLEEIREFFGSEEWVHSILISGFKGYGQRSDKELLDAYAEILENHEYLIPDNELPIRPDEMPQLFPQWRGGTLKR